MIAKERSTHEHLGRGRRGEAGAAAEEQMAFYLRRTFADDPNVCVFNDLRIGGLIGADWASSTTWYCTPTGSS